MDSLSFDNFHARKRNAMVKLVKGKEIAVQLQTLLREPVRDRGPVSAENLAFQIYRSFSDTLSELSSCTSDQIPAVDGGASASSGDSGNKKKRAVKDRRGCYKRRRTSDSWESRSPSMEDNYAWRKYGQKAIFGADYPRSYFRCTHKKEGCKALKQVQRIKGDEVMYQTTYLNHHTCNETLRAPPLVVDSDPIDPNLISFQTSNPSEQDKHGQFCNNSTKKPLVVSSVKREECVSEDVSNEAKSTLEDPWHNITGLDYEPLWAPYQDEVESASVHGLDMDVDQLCDLQNFKYFDQMY